MKKLHTQSVNRRKVSLRPCPFCGSRPDYWAKMESKARPGNFYPETVRCVTCNICIVGDDAVQRWNKRMAADGELAEAVHQVDFAVNNCNIIGRDAWDVLKPSLRRLCEALSN